MANLVITVVPLIYYIDFGRAQAGLDLALFLFSFVDNEIKYENANMRLDISSLFLKRN